MNSDKLLTGVLAFHQWLGCLFVTPVLIFLAVYSDLSNPEVSSNFTGLATFVGFFFMFLSLIQFVYFLHHLFFVNEGLDNKWFWACAIVFFGGIGIPLYWVQFIGRVPAPLYRDDYGLS